MHRAISFFVAALVAANAFAASDHDHGAHRHGEPPAASATTAVAAELAHGEIRKVDQDGGKLTIQHGPLRSLDMPGMTMVFGVKDPALLARVQVGQKVRFAAEKIEGRLVVTRIEAATP